MEKLEEIKKEIDLIDHKIAVNDEIKKARMNALNECYVESRKLNSRRMELLDELSNPKNNDKEITEKHEMYDK